MAGWSPGGRPGPFWAQKLAQKSDFYDSPISHFISVGPDPMRSLQSYYIKRYCLVGLGARGASRKTPIYFIISVIYSIFRQNIFLI